MTTEGVVEAEEEEADAKANGGRTDGGRSHLATANNMRTGHQRISLSLLQRLQREVIFLFSHMHTLAMKKSFLLLITCP